MKEGPTFTRTYRYRLGFFVDPSELVVELVHLEVDGTRFPLGRRGLAEADSQLPWLAKMLRRLELKLDDSERLRTPPGVVREMQATGVSAFQALSMGLGRCIEKNGLTWFTGKEESQIPYSIVFDGVDIDCFDYRQIPYSFAEKAMQIVRSNPGRSWVWLWSRTKFPGASLQLSSDGNVVHAEVMIEDDLGNVGLGSKAFRPTHEADVINAFRQTSSRALEDLQMTRHCALFQVTEGTATQRYLADWGGDNRSQPPDGFLVFGWQAPEGPGLSEPIKLKVAESLQRGQTHFQGVDIEDLSLKSLCPKTRMCSASS